MKKSHMHKPCPENTDHNTPIKKPTKSRCWESSTAERLKKWALKPDSYMIEVFYTNEDMPRQTFYDGVARNEELKAAHEYALERVGINRENLAIEKNLGLNSVAAFILPHYLDRWKKEIEWRQALKALYEKDQQSLGKISIEDWIMAKMKELK